MTEFHLLRPEWLWGLLPLLLVNRLWQQRQNQSRNWERYCDAALLPHLLQRADGVADQRSRLLLNLLVLLALLALAGPTTQKQQQPLLQDRSALVVVLDLSQSMSARDVKPSRLERLRLKLIDILDYHAEGLNGLIVVAGEPFVVTPLTTDVGTIKAMVQGLDSSIMPIQGSHPERAIPLAQQILEQANIRHGEVLILTDGLSGECGEACQQAAQALRQAGHSLAVIAVGTAEGAPIPLPKGGYLKDSSGEIIISRLHTAPLQQMVDRAGGGLRLLTVDDSDFKALLKQGLWLPDSSEAGHEATQKSVEWLDQGAWLVVMMVPLAALLFRRGLWIGLPLLLLAQSEPSGAWELPFALLNPNQQGVKLLEQGDTAAAVERLTEPSWQGVARYRSGDFKGAAAALEGLSGATERYNRATALAQAGEIEAAMAGYEALLAEHPDHADGRYNLELLRQFKQQQHDSAQPNPAPDRASNGADSESASGQSSDNARGGESESKSSEAASDADQTAAPEGATTAPSEPHPAEPGSETAAKGEGEGEGKDPPAAQRSQGDSGGSGGEGELAQPLQAGQDAAEGGEPASLGGDADSQGTEGATATAEPTQSGEFMSPNGSKTATETAPPLPPASAVASATATATTPPHNAATPPEQQWLRQIPDDPGALLRRKLGYMASRLYSDRPQEPQPW